MKSRRFKKNSSLSVDDQIFYHDLLNHLHSIGLFCDLHRDDPIFKDDLRHMERELQLINAMIDERLLVAQQSKRLRSLSTIVNNFQDLSQHYLGHIECDVAWDVHVGMAELKGRLVDWAPIERVMNNLFKNIYESGAHYCRFKMYLTKRNFHVRILNNFNYFDDEDTDGGLGIQSINKCLKAIGGSYRYSGEGNFWHGHLVLPTYLRDEENFLAA